VITGGLRRILVSLAVPIGVLALAGCSSLSPDGAAAGDVALAFSAALRDAEAGQACELLAESTRTGLESRAETPCDSAILEEDLPLADAVVEVAAFGRNARVILDGDVVFLMVEAGDWKVLAAGCEFRSTQPYDCSLEAS